mmetsp:Transcript_43118/g.111760  ORF Transcript_43118/g.111760 Transcript_43118/m.111760 type:complete len:241 (+) Transcript_43118:204-926(+)
MSFFPSFCPTMCPLCVLSSLTQPKQQNHSHRHRGEDMGTMAQKRTVRAILLASITVLLLVGLSYSLFEFSSCHSLDGTNAPFSRLAHGQRERSVLCKVASLGFSSFLSSNTGKKDKDGPVIRRQRVDIEAETVIVPSPPSHEGMTATLTFLLLDPWLFRQNWSAPSSSSPSSSPSSSSPVSFLSSDPDTLFLPHVKSLLDEDELRGKKKTPSPYTAGTPPSAKAKASSFLSNTSAPTNSP